MTTLEIILSVLTGLSGLGNLTQWLNLKAVREKANYEADEAHIQNLKSVIDLQADEIRRLQERVKELEDTAEERERRFEERERKFEERIRQLEEQIKQ